MYILFYICVTSLKDDFFFTEFISYSVLTVSYFRYPIVCGKICVLKYVFLSKARMLNKNMKNNFFSQSRFFDSSLKSNLIRFKNLMIRVITVILGDPKFFDFFF